MMALPLAYIAPPPPFDESELFSSNVTALEIFKLELEYIAPPLNPA